MTEVHADAAERFIERIGQIMEQDGLTRIAGRIFGYLLLTSEPKSLEDLATELRASRGSVSQETRLLERLGALERVTHAGDRRVFYQIGDRMMARMVALRIERFRMLREALEDGERVAAGAGDDLVRKRMVEFGDFCEHLLHSVNEAGECWCTEHGVKKQ